MNFLKFFNKILIEEVFIWACDEVSIWISGWYHKSLRKSRPMKDFARFLYYKWRKFLIKNYCWETQRTRMKWSILKNNLVSHKPSKNSQMKKIYLDRVGGSWVGQSVRVRWTWVWEETSALTNLNTPKELHKRKI